MTELGAALRVRAAPRKERWCEGGREEEAGDVSITETATGGLVCCPAKQEAPRAVEAVLVVAAGSGVASGGLGLPRCRRCAWARSGRLGAGRRPLFLHTQLGRRVDAVMRTGAVGWSGVSKRVKGKSF